MSSMRRFLKFAEFSLTLLCLHAALAEIAHYTFFQNHQLANLVFAEDLLFQSAARSNVDCLRQCVSNPCCVTYTYGKGKLCRGHVRRKTAGSNSTGCPGCRTFYKVNHTVSTANAKNIAFGKTATQSSLHISQTPASNAVDNNTNSDFRAYSCSCTSPEAQGSWWQVDLGRQYFVTSVAITNRGDCCGDWLRDFDVDVYTQNPVTHSSARATLCYHYAGPMPQGATETLNCSGESARGRYLRITDAPNFNLQLCEVQVFALCYGTPDVNLLH